ncbi:hypothetical protein CYR32_12230 [Chimaeribacter coloradensis]|uniref:Uncharacterized protein n=1 Tax=Chimaeribacter coloradensis TaxID=2060068 RepID=A0A2N5E1V8_9GAMM|nr:hypothetical protein CYR32_12230 [Chimaeribacter coloradensis]
MHSVEPLWFNERHLWSVRADTPDVSALVARPGRASRAFFYGSFTADKNSGPAMAGFKQKGHQ